MMKGKNGITHRCLPNKMPMEDTIIRHFFYRGSLKSCNYFCSYCPFAKHFSNKAEIEKDKHDLFRFVEYIERSHFNNPVSILLTPYGEALIHNYYQEALIRLSKSSNTSFVSCQTNLSFDISSFTRLILNSGGFPSKMGLWASFHPEMTSVNNFVEKVKYLDNYITINAGAVGNPASISQISELRLKLPKDIYLWINKMDRLGRSYTPYEIKQFCNIDSLFSLELKPHKFTPGTCEGGHHSFFIRSDGSMFACSRSHHKLGNLYHAKEPNSSSFHCSGKCDCFLAYSNRKNLLKLTELHPFPQLRMNLKNNSSSAFDLKALFFDIDGTITGDNGRIRSSAAKALNQLSKQYKIFLVTGLPYQSAMKKCAPLKNSISGGVFAYGSDIRDFNIEHHQIKSLGTEKKIMTLLDSHILSMNKEGDIPYKLLIRGNCPKELLSGFHVTEEKNKNCSVVSIKSDKKNGILGLMKENKWTKYNILVMGNDIPDIPMLSFFPFSAAPPSSSKEVLSSARYICEVEELINHIGA